VPVLEMPGHPRSRSRTPSGSSSGAFTGCTRATTSRRRAKKKKAREALVASVFPVWGANAERALGDGPFFAGAKLHVVDLKLYMIVRWFLGGAVDHVPATVFASFPKLTRVHDAVRDDARVKAWVAKT